MVLLDLRASELLIYALFYSYTVGTEGLFYASLDYISEQTGISRRTVNRVVQNMLSQGLIERCEINGRAGLRTVMSVAERLKRIYTANANELRKLTRSVQNQPKKAEENRGEVKAEDHSMPSDKKWRPAEGRFWLPDVYTGKHYEAEPKYRLSAFGQEGMVKMTLEQYEKLKTLVPDRVLKHYVDRLASIHIQRGSRDELWRKCDYQIIRKWIDEDFKT
jgi:DNA-binding Lrp family transcriptional regulator